MNFIFRPYVLAKYTPAGRLFKLTADKDIVGSGIGKSSVGVAGNGASNTLGVLADVISGTSIVTKLDKLGLISWDDIDLYVFPKFLISLSKLDIDFS
jgi:hypothetical protein